VNVYGGLPPLVLENKTDPLESLHSGKIINGVVSISTSKQACALPEKALKQRQSRRIVTAFIGSVSLVTF
jgi:hypothetical protein